jgi:predicted DNA repair protein MutK
MEVTDLLVGNHLMNPVLLLQIEISLAWILFFLCFGGVAKFWSSLEKQKNTKSKENDNDNQDN